MHVRHLAETARAFVSVPFHYRISGMARTLETLLQLLSTSQFFSDLLITNPDFLDMLRVPLTTVSWSTSAMGQAAAQLLLDLVDGKKSTAKSRHVSIPPELVIRRSCGALKQKIS